MSLAFNQSAMPEDGKEVGNLVSFLYMFIDFIKDERVMQDLQKLMRQYELGNVDHLLNREVH
jgi:hypothetical protein